MDAHQLSAESESTLFQLRRRHSASLRAGYWQLWRWMAAGSAHWLPVVSLKREEQARTLALDVCSDTPKVHYMRTHAVSFLSSMFAMSQRAQWKEDFRLKLHMSPQYINEAQVG